jgi:hypothetical protein
VVLLELDPGSFVGGPADIPDWANRAAVIGRALVVVLSLTAGVASRGAPRPGVAVGALMPVAFLLTNRIFSTQLLVLIPVAWAVAGARLARSRPGRQFLAWSAWPATMCNPLVYPATIDLSQPASAALFGLAFAATAWLFRSAAQEDHRLGSPLSR